MIEIQHGCERDRFNDLLYRYTEESTKYTLDGYDKIPVAKMFTTVHIFATQAGEKPDIGDFIVQGVLQKRTKPKVNNDWSKWKDKDL